MMSSKVLLIEDDPATAERLVNICRRLGLDVSYCANIVEAQAALRSDQPFLALLVDLMLPPNFRDEGIRFIEGLDDRNEAQIISFSAREDSMKQIVDRAYQAGSRRFLDKNATDFSFEFERELELVIRESRSRVFISYGHNELLKLKWRQFISQTMRKNTILFDDIPSRGKTVIEKLEIIAALSCFAVVLMTADDLLADGGVRARQNVIHEVGYFQGYLGRHRVVLLVERGVEIFTNISGIVTIGFVRDHFEACFEALRLEIDAAFREDAADVRSN